MQKPWGSKNTAKGRGVSGVVGGVLRTAAARRVVGLKCLRLLQLVRADEHEKWTELSSQVSKWQTLLKFRPKTKRFALK